MELVTTASLITAFIAGFAGLLAPCCVGVLLPAYLGSVFKTRTKIFLMTFVYFLGILTIFLPLGLGIAGLSSFFSSNHTFIFTAGALFMIFLGAMMLLGKNMILPFHVHPKIKQHDFGSIYLLGVFSGVATTCCAPVLAGVLALSGLSGSVWLGGVYAMTFVLGMVIPLFLMALLVDQSALIKRITSLRRRVNYTIFNRRISLNLSHLISGIIYILFGLFILVFERTNPGGMGASYQVDLNIWAAKLTRFISRTTHFLPQAFWYVFFILVFAGIAWLAYRQAGEEMKKAKETNVH